MTVSSVAEALTAGDLDELSRWVDRFCEVRDWDGLTALRDASRDAFARRGHQLWPIASQAEYRLALEAPAGWAGRVLVDGAGRFALGPLPEVVASTHTWEELAAHVAPTPAAALAAHERVLRGERIDDDARIDVGVLELPLALQSWEPQYALATYESHRALFPAPRASALVRRELPSPGATVEDPEVSAALRALVERWVIESNGEVGVVAVEATAEAAVGALGHREVGWAEIEPAEALAAMAWAGASGGAHGRRLGAATGRFGAWWALAALAGMLDDWPAVPEDLGDVASALRWARWHPLAPALGWSLHLAVEDPHTQLAWAIAATDHT